MDEIGLCHCGGGCGMVSIREMDAIVKEEAMVVVSEDGMWGRRTMVDLSM